MKKLTVLLSVVMLSVSIFAQEAKEQKLYFTNFQDWDAVSSSTTATTKTVTTQKSNETLTFTFAETAIAPTGTNAKFTNTEVVTAGYAQSAKSATPYIETSALASITKVHFVQAATGGSRGWGLMAKGDGDTAWDTVYSTYATQAGAAVDVAINKTNCQLRFYNLSSSQNGYLLELGIYGNVVDTRTFQDFTINLQVDPYSLPAGVSEASYAKHGKSFNGAQHGWQWAAFGFKVDGPVEITLGGCQYINAGYNGYVVSALTGDTLGQIENKTTGCYHNTGDTASWTYNVEAADSLIVYCGQYCPYLAVRKTDFVENYTIQYFDQNGTKLGEESLAPGSVFTPLYGESDLPAIASGKLFRGWYTNMGIKVTAGQALTGDLKVYAKVTDIEVANVGTHYLYDLTKNSFYMEDHELISATGVFHDGTHGWIFANGQEMTLVVSPKSYVSLALCTYSNTADQIIRNAAGDSIACMHVIKSGTDGATADGTLCSFYNESAQQDTIHFNFTTTSYIHSVEVYNVAAPLAKTGHVYDIAAGDAATFMMVCKMLVAGDTIQLHDGLYDLGEVTLTTISADSIVVRGESMTGTIIKNAPDAKLESIDKTATLVNTGKGNVYELLTLQNALDYYKANNGRAVAFWDKGTNTACYNVRLLSYQDTYYSNKPGQQCWWEDCEIHGTVDYICGSGSVYFYNTLLFCEKRNSTGGGSDCITASNAQTARGDKGYVFDRCTMKSECPTVSLSRSWNDQPQVAYLLTTLDYSAGEFSLTDGGGILRWTREGMNSVVPECFAEYNTMDVDGNIISPESNSVNFIGKENKQMETIIGYEDAEAKSYIHFFTDWAPARNYETFPMPATALENTDAENGACKYMLNGQLVIERNGVRYDALGREIK